MWADTGGGEDARTGCYERVDARGNVIGIAIFNFLKRDRGEAGFGKSNAAT
ncbi:MAG: hypothetical protein ACHQ9S_25965 [Candidatus Binatia bacterium]